MKWRRKAASKLTAEGVAVLERYGLELVGDTVDVSGLDPNALLVLFRAGFCPVENEKP